MLGVKMIRCRWREQVLDKHKQKVMVVIGTRPEAIKMWPVIQALKAHPDCQTHVCLTAQHRDMLDMFVAELGIHPDSDLDLMRSGQTLAELSGRLIPAFSELLQAHRPDMVLVQGDTTTAALAALTAFYEDIYVGHVEAGLRSGNRRSPFPEEVNRRMTATLADLHFAPTKQAQANLLAEGVPADAVRVTGNTVIDAVKGMAGDVPQSASPRVLMTAHRRENFGEPLQEILAGVRQIASEHPELEIIYPVHPNPNVYAPAHEVLGSVANIHLCEPMGYREFVTEMQKAWFVLSDSGGVQEEATALGRPVLLLRKETERPEGMAAGNVRAVPLQQDGVACAVREMIDDGALRQSMMTVSDVFGDGTAGQYIVEATMGFLKQEKQQ